MKDTYLNDLIGELSRIELDPNIVEESSSVSHATKTLKASKYSPFTNPSYESLISLLAHKTLAEVQLLDDNQRSRIISLLEKHIDNISQACAIWRKYYEKPQIRWGSYDLVKELHHHFSINTAHIEWFVEADPIRDKTDLLEDIGNSLARKYQVATWLMNEIKEYIPREIPSAPKDDNRINVFNKLDLSEAEKWFMQLATNYSTNGKLFLSVSEVERFITRAFVGDTTISKRTLNMAKGERTSITKLFYMFYERCTKDYATENTRHCKEKYVRLLTDNFTNYKYDTVFNNFNNSNKAPKEWGITV